MPTNYGGLERVRPQPIACKAHRERDPIDLRPGCFEAATPGHLYCREHQTAHVLARLTKGKALNRRRGLCRCGATPTEGLTAWGRPWRTCIRCRLADRAPRAKRRTALKSLPKELRRYDMGGSRGYLHAMHLHQWELRRAREWERKAAPILPALTDMQQAFVRLYIEQGQRNATQAARLAGYGEQSMANGGSAARVAGCRLLKRADIQKAIREVVSERAERLRRDRALLAALEAERDRRAMLEAMGVESMAELRESMTELLEDAGRRLGPQSKAARLARRYRGQAMLRLPGRCRCGEQSDPGTASCAPCRRERRHYRRRYRARCRLLRAA